MQRFLNHGDSEQARRPIDGVLLLDKPRGITSQRAVSRVKALLAAAKVGHTGTLDPMANGLLPLTFGEATKFSHALLDADKSYDAVVQLGVTTSTGDADGQILERSPVSVTLAQIDETLAEFLGEIEQTPPMYSALKVAGKPLYAYARRGVEIERKPRRVCIRGLRLVERRGDLLELAVTCSKGTYIRVLAEDIGRALGCGASLAELRRTVVGRFNVSDAIALDLLEQATPAERDAYLLPPDTLVQELPRVALSDEEAIRLARGQSVASTTSSGGLVRVYDGAGAFLGVAEAGESTLAPRRLIAAKRA